MICSWCMNEIKATDRKCPTCHNKLGEYELSDYDEYYLEEHSA